MHRAEFALYCVVTIEEEPAAFALDELIVVLADKVIGRSISIEQALVLLQTAPRTGGFHLDGADLHEEGRIDDGGHDLVEHRADGLMAGQIEVRALPASVCREAIQPCVAVATAAGVGIGIIELANGQVLFAWSGKRHGQSALGGSAMVSV